MKKIKRFLAIVVSCCCFALTGCLDKLFYNGYSNEEILVSREKFSSFQNSEDFVLEYFDRIWLLEKDVVVDELIYNGKKIDRMMGCGDGYLYASIRIKKSRKNYTMHLLQVDYDTLEMTEIRIFENLKERYTSACRYVNGKFYFSDGDKYCIYDHESGVEEWFEYDHEEFWKNDDERYSFEMSYQSGDPIKVIDTLTGEEKTVSLKDAGYFEEGLYIQEVDAKFEKYSSRFVDATEKDGICYLLMLMPFDSFSKNQAVIFAYDFESDTLSYYSSTEYDWDERPSLTIIDRR